MLEHLGETDAANIVNQCEDPVSGRLLSAIAALANSYGAAPARATAAKEMLVHALEGASEAADAADGYAAAAALAALAHGIEAEAGRGLDWLSVAALQEWDFHHPESPI